MPARHEMVRTDHAAGGAEEWSCPSCGRRMLMRWTPEFDTLLLEHGDDSAVHFGTQGGLRLHSLDVGQDPDSTAPEADTRWLASNGIDWDDPPAG